MDRVLAVNAEDLDCRVQAGVTPRCAREALGERRACSSPSTPAPTRRSAAWRPPRASGTTHHPLRHDARERARPGGRARRRTVIRTGSRARKSSAGYDLTRLLLGSRGHARGHHRADAAHPRRSRRRSPPRAASFDDARRRRRARSIEAVQLGIPMARCELLDPAAIARRQRARRADASPRRPRCSSSSTARRPAVAEQVEAVREIAAEHGGGELRVGRRRPRSASGCGARATTRTSPAWRCGRARARMHDRRVRADLAAGREHRRTERRARASWPSRAAWSATSPTATSTWICLVDPDDSETSGALAEGFVERMVDRAHRAPAARAPASTASACGKRERWPPRRARRRSTMMRAIKRALDPRGTCSTPARSSPDA